MPSLGPLEILVVVIVAVLVFPPEKLPDVARKLGRGFRELRRFQGSLSADLERMMADEPEPPPRLPPRAIPGADERHPPEGDSTGDEPGTSKRDGA